MTPARIPPVGLAGLDPRWSRLVTTTARDGQRRTWHVLDSGERAPVGTLLAVHGNPTWSYLWRGLLAAPPEGWRVLAVDHLGMGWSERVPTRQRLADRVADLGAVTAALDVDGPVVTVGHDWGGSISLGWALQHRDQVAGVVLLNTAVSQPPGSPVPALIAAATTPGALDLVCRRTPAFVRGTLRLAHPALPAEVRAAYLAPYRTAADREAVAWFVGDIPLRADAPSRPTLDAIVERLPELSDVPALVLWGPRDPVFRERYLRDLLERFPHADVQRYEGAGHLLPEDRDVSAPIRHWLASRASLADRDSLAPVEASWSADGHATPTPGGETIEHRTYRPLWAALDERRGDDGPAVVELGERPRTVSWGRLASVVDDLAAGLAAHGVSPGDRVALLVPPGADLVATLYACWRVGAVVVVADAGLGRTGLTTALRSASPRYLVGIPRALAAARVLGWPGRRIAVHPLGVLARRLTGTPPTLVDVARRGRGATPLPPPGPDDEAAVLFTSGATGPAKGVVYRHRQLAAQRDLVAATYGVGRDDRLVAAFAPFALYGPALGITSAVPDMDVTAPGTLTASALADAVEAVDATLVFAAPAALTSVLASADDLDDRHRAALADVRLLLSAGAPVPVPLLERVQRLVPRAELHTPYGMTEALPVTDVSLDGIRAAHRAAAHAGTDPRALGVCVGRPLAGVQVAVAPLDGLGRADDDLVDKPGVTGEICVLAAHVKDRYDRLWATESATRLAAGWHRTGDVGHLDDDGRLWVAGRLGHVVTTAEGPVTPVGVEQLAESVDGVARAAAVGVGPCGTQALVVVVEPAAHLRVRPGLAPLDLTDAVRAAVAGIGTAPAVAALLVVDRLPVDVRHNSKVDRARVAAWAARVLAGGRGRAT